MSGEKILIIDDEKELLDVISMYLKSEDFIIEKSQDGREGYSKYQTFKPDMVILDIKLPGMDGMELCRNIRRNSDIPILMLSAKNGDMDKVLSLGLGADDYVTKPFSTNELVARIKAHLRRYTGISSNKKEILQYGKLQIDCKSYSVSVEGKPVTLAAKEFEVLSFLARHPNRVFSKEQVFDQVWGYDEFGDVNTVTVHIRKIREKIEEDPSSPQYIKTVWSVGYKFEGGSK
ncbi:MAG: response regulator transcription factor [Bacillota bacterium]|nr:response regulator transcription factor [Bacillota bacterium]